MWSYSWCGYGLCVFGTFYIIIIIMNTHKHFNYKMKIMFTYFILIIFYIYNKKKINHRPGKSEASRGAAARLVVGSIPPRGD